jgi:hypothetical protein
MIDDQVSLSSRALLEVFSWVVRFSLSENLVYSPRHFAVLMGRRSLLQMLFLLAPNLSTIFVAVNQCKPCTTELGYSVSWRYRWESTTLTISYRTPLEIVEQLRTRINAYIITNSRDWSGFALNIDKMEYQNAIYLVIAVERMCIISSMSILIIVYFFFFARSSQLARLGWEMGTPNHFHATLEDYTGRS